MAIDHYVQQPRGTLSGLMNLSAQGELRPGQIYILEDESRMAFATTRWDFVMLPILDDVMPPKIYEDTINILTAEYYEARSEFYVWGITPQTRVQSWLVPNEDWDLDDLLDFKISAETDYDMLRFVIGREGPIVGAFKIQYILDKRAL